MANLLKETISDIRHYGRDIAEVVWVGSRDGTIADSWAHFASLADVEYDEDYGIQEIARDLVVVAKDWWLERHEHDGKEWWEFKTIPRIQDNPDAFTNVMRNRGDQGDRFQWDCSLRKINYPSDDS